MRDGAFRRVVSLPIGLAVAAIRGFSDSAHAKQPAADGSD